MRESQLKSWSVTMVEVPPRVVAPDILIDQTHFQQEANGSKAPWLGLIVPDRNSRLTS